MTTHVFGRLSLASLSLLAATSIAVAQVNALAAPKITSVSKITTAQHQTITITGSGFGTHKPYTGDSRFISLYDKNKKWEAGNAADGDTVTLIVNSWTNTKITLGGFAGKWGTQNFTLGVGNKVLVRVWNAQGPGGSGGLTCPAGTCASKTVSVAAALTMTEVSSSPNPSVMGQPVTFTAVVTSGGGVPTDGGKVVFMRGAEVLGSATLRDGVARFTTSKLGFGTNQVRAVYAGDAEFESSRPDESTAAETHTVQ